MIIITVPFHLSLFNDHILVYTNKASSTEIFTPYTALGILIAEGQTIKIKFFSNINLLIYCINLFIINNVMQTTHKVHQAMAKMKHMQQFVS